MAPQGATSRDSRPANKRVAQDATERPAKKPKKTISVAGLFAKKPQHSDAADDSTLKSLSAEDGLTAKAKRHPIYLDVKGEVSVLHFNL